MGNKLLNKITRIVNIIPDKFLIELEFQDKAIGKVDLSEMFSEHQMGPLVKEILRGQIFHLCFVEAGALAWPNGLELCADTLREIATLKKKKAA